VIEGPVGAGGMGEVYRAHDARLNRTVAIKIVPERVAADEDLRNRFDREVKVLAALSHPNIVAIFDVGTHEGTPYAAMELLDGTTLRDRIAGAPLPLRTAVDYAVHIGRGLAAAHDKGIVHRDLKPDNIFVTRDGQVKILDFGLASDRVSGTAAASEVTRQYTERGMVLGTVGYLSPEQARGEAADARSDIFSFGCVLYEMVSGQRAFTGDSGIEILHAILKNHPPDLLTSGKDIPPALDRLITRCVEKAPASRFQTARDLVFSLENMLDAPTPALSHAVAAAPAKKPGWLLPAAAVLGVAIVGGGWWVYSQRKAPGTTAAESTATAPRLLAVLPFENITRDGKPGYFGAGMTEEVMGQLSKVNSLRVVSRAAVGKFKDIKTDLAAMTAELGISGVVTGSVREDGDHVRVNVELVDAQSGQQLWSEQYDRAGSDVFAMQSDIALKVADVLKASVTLDEQARLGRRPTSNLAAYELLTRARSGRAAPGTTPMADIKSRIALAQQAIDLDPKFALAYAQVARFSVFLYSYGDHSVLERGLAAAKSAVAIDPNLAQAHHALGIMQMSAGNMRDAVESLKRATELGPSFSTAFSDLSVTLVNASRFDESLIYAKKGVQLEPNVLFSYYHVAAPLVYLDDDAQTERYLTAADARFPNRMRLQALLAVLDWRRGRTDAAVDRINKAVAASPRDPEGLIWQAELATLSGAPDGPRLTQALQAESAEALGQLSSYSMKLLQAYNLQRAGQKAQASKLMDEILKANQTQIEAGSDQYMPFLQMAAVHALRGETAAAIDGLEQCYGAGLRDARFLQHDPVVASLRTEPRFTALVSRMEADVAAMRAKADYSGLVVK